MQAGGRLAAAIEILADIEARRRPVAEALKDWGLSHRFAGSKDRSAIGNIVYDALRWRLSTLFSMGEESARALVLGTIGRRWGLGSLGLSSMLAGEHGPAPLSEAEAATIDRPLPEGAPAYIRADIPEWLSARFEGLFGADWVEEGVMLALRPPLDLRANPLKVDREKVLRALAAQDASAARFAPYGMRIPPTALEGRHPNVQIEPSFIKGWFEVQDEGSQLVALLAGPKPGEQVLDYCAGAGGKTLAIAAAMGNKGQIHATDSDRARLAPIYDRLRRSGARNVQIRDPRGAPLDDLKARMDRVLVDAPCTGTGIWRRRPDAKWRLTERALEERKSEQVPIVASAAEFVRPGGSLTYVTCSLLSDENEGQISAFLAARPDFSALDGAALIAQASLPEETKTALADAMLLLPLGAYLTPRRTGTDGFFVSVLKRGA